jgi:hypothetical protein
LASASKEKTFAVERRKRMPRNLRDLSEEERAALLEAHWDALLEADAEASTEAVSAPRASAVASRLPANLAPHLKPGNLASWGIINGSCGGGAKPLALDKTVLDKAKKL